MEATNRLVLPDLSNSDFVDRFSPVIACDTDRVYSEQEGTDEIYKNTASDIVKSALEGVNGTFFESSRCLLF